MLVGAAFAASLAFALDPHQALRHYGHRSWQTDTGLPQNTVHAILQTRDGYLWLATEGGLVRFDGTQFAVYDRQAPARLPSASVNSLFEDSRGDLWIGTEGGLARRRGERFATFGSADGLPSDTVWSVFETDAGHRGAQLWVVTPAGLARYRGDGPHGSTKNGSINDGSIKGGQFEAVPVAQGVANAKSVAPAADGSLWIGTNSGLERWRENGSGVGRMESYAPLAGVETQTVAATADGRVWAGTRAGLYWFSPEKPGSLRQASGLPSNEIASLTVARDGALWIGTAKGLAVRRNGATTLYSARDGLPSDRVEAAFEDREGAMWIATGRGVARVFEGKIEAFGEREGLSGESVLSFLEDREGSLWLGTESGGLEMLHDQKFTAYTTADGLADDLVRSVFPDRSGAVWIGTNGGGLDRFDHGKFAALTTANGLSSDIVLALGADAAGSLWVGTPDGLNRIRDGRISTYTSADGLADDFVRSLYAASDGSMWIGTRRGLSHLENGRFTSYSAMDGLGSDLVGAVVEDRGEDRGAGRNEDHLDDRAGNRPGSLWIGTLGGLTHFDGAKFSTLTTRDGLSSNVVTALYQDAQGTLWIGTNQGGLNRLRAGKITPYPTAKNGLPESVYAILEDGRGNLWLSAKTGVYSVAKRELDRYADHPGSPLAVAAYGTADGMRIAECSSGGHPAAWKLADGTMWFATLKGVAAVDPEHLTRNAVPPPVAIEEVLVDDQPADFQTADAGAALSLAPGTRRFEFRYAGLSFIAPQKVRFRYRLDGFDHDWIDAGTRRAAYYTNLPPGTYRFRVLACNNDGVWNEAGAALDFRLRPHYYQTYWFYLAAALALALLAYQIYRWRLRQVEIRYGAVLSERGRIAREIHDTLAQGLVGISVQLELVNRLLASSVESARTQLDQARGLVRESIAEARSSIWELRSQAAETEDLATRIARMAARATESSDAGGSGEKIRVISRVLGTYRPLPPRTEAELLRIAQEAVTNAIRHGQPARIDLELRFAAREVQLTIADDGRGFDGQPHPQSSGPQGHFGLAGMRERAQQIGGALTIESAPGKGTRVSVQVGIDG